MEDLLPTATHQAGDARLRVSTAPDHHPLTHEQALASDASSSGLSVRVLVAGLSKTCSQKIHKYVRLVEVQRLNNV